MSDLWLADIGIPGEVRSAGIDFDGAPFRGRYRGPDPVGGPVTPPG